MKPYYTDKNATIYLDDCRNVIPELKQRFSVSITDPPYGETRLTWDKWIDGWTDLLLRRTPQLWCFGSFRMFLEKRGEFEKWKLAQEIVWEKQNGSGLHNDRFRRVHELAAHFYVGEWGQLHHKPVMTFDAQKRTVRRQTKPAHWGQLSAPAFYSVPEGGPRLMRSVMFCKNSHRASFHPTQKPEDIVMPLLEYSCPPGGRVIDPFMGSGTTLVCAKRTGRFAVGIDAREEYCERAANRLQTTFVETKLKNV
jgi:site-specific DNA-methyltransferase (adenine-specific)